MDTKKKGNTFVSRKRLSIKSNTTSDEYKFNLTMFSEGMKHMQEIIKQQNEEINQLKKNQKEMYDEIMDMRKLYTLESDIETLKEDVDSLNYYHFYSDKKFYSDGGFENEESEIEESETEINDSNNKESDNEESENEESENEESKNEESKNEESENDETKNEKSGIGNEQKQKSWAQAASSHMNDDYDLNGDNTEDEETIEETETVKETATGSSTSPSFYDSETLSEDFIKEDTVKNVHYNFLLFGNGTVNYKRIRNTENPFIIYYYTLRGNSKGIEIGRIPTEYESEVRLGGYKRIKNRYYFEIMSFTDDLLNLCPEAAFWQEKINSHY